MDDVDNVNIVKVGNKVITITIGSETRYLGIGDNDKPHALTKREYDTLNTRGKIRSVAEQQATVLANRFGNGKAVQINFVDPAGAAQTASAYASAANAGGPADGDNHDDDDFESDDGMNSIHDAIIKVNHSIFEYRRDRATNAAAISEQLTQLRSLYQQLINIDLSDTDHDYRNYTIDSLIQILAMIQDKASQIPTLPEINQSPHVAASNRIYTDEELKMIANASIVLASYDRTIDTKCFFFKSLPETSQQEVLRFISRYITSRPDLPANRLLSVQRLCQDFLPESIGPDEQGQLVIPQDPLKCELLSDGFVLALTEGSFGTFLDVIGESLGPKDVITIATASLGVAVSASALPFGQTVINMFKSLVTQAAPLAGNVVLQHPLSTIGTILGILKWNEDSSVQQQLSPAELAIRELLERLVPANMQLQRQPVPLEFGFHQIFAIIQNIGVLGWNTLCSQSAYAHQLSATLTKLPGQISSICSMASDVTQQQLQTTALNLASRNGVSMSETIYSGARKHLEKLLSTEKYSSLKDDPEIRRILDRMMSLDDKEKLNEANVRVHVMRDILANGPGRQHEIPSSSGAAAGGDTPKNSFSSVTLDEFPQFMVPGGQGEMMGVVHDVIPGAKLGTGESLLDYKNRPTRLGPPRTTIQTNPGGPIWIPPKTGIGKQVKSAAQVSDQVSAQGSSKAPPGKPGKSKKKGGRSRSRKSSVSKRTRRKGVAKKQKSKKNKRQSRRKVHRASSRKGRK